ncbi:MAG: hypothetical protein AAGJ34_00130 [Pseudomonadota bacterium]
MLVPNYATLLVVMTALFLTAGLSVLLSYGILKSPLVEKRRQRMAWTIGMFSALWLSTVLLISHSNALVPEMEDVVPWLGVAIATSTLLIGMLALVPPAMRGILTAVPIGWFAGIQIYRVIGAVFLLLEADGLLSKYFALSTAWGDIFVGVTAPIIAILLTRDARRFLWLGVTWCIIGIADLVLVLFKAINSAPGPRQTTAFDIPTEVVGYFPFSILPLVIVPLSIVLHLVLIQRLLAQRSRPAVGKLSETI